MIEDIINALIIVGFFMLGYICGFWVRGKLNENRY